MKHSNLLKRSVVPLASLGLATAAAQLSSPAVKLEPPAEPQLNRFGASFRPAFNVNVNFLGVGSFSPIAPTRTTPDGDAFNYDDGYVLVDSSGNVMGYTRYWGYDFDSGPFNQVPGNGTVVMHSSSSAGVSTKADTDDPMLGFELTYNREFGRDGSVSWGLEAAFNYLNVHVRDSRSMMIGYTRIATPYQLPALEGGGFVSPPPAPFYHGADLSPEGNPVINATPGTPEPSQEFTSMTGARNLDANVFGFRLGPYVELSLSEKVSVALSGGLSLACVNSDFNFNEQLGLPNVPSVSGAGSHADLLVGGYVAGNINYQMDKDWGLFAGVQFQNVGKYRHAEAGRTAVIDLSKTVFVVVGANFSF